MERIWHGTLFRSISILISSFIPIGYERRLVNEIPAVDSNKLKIQKGRVMKLIIKLSHGILHALELMNVMGSLQVFY